MLPFKVKRKRHFRKWVKVTFVILLIFFGFALAYLNKPISSSENLTQRIEKENISKASIFEEDIIPYSLEEYMDINPYVFGLLSFNDQGILRNIPIVESKNKQWGDYWMTHNVFFEDDTLGCAFLDEQTPLNSSNNLRINGHASYANNRMFTFLKQYLDSDYFNIHATFILEELFAKSTYEIIFMARYDVESDSLVSANWLQANLSKTDVEKMMEADKDAIIQIRELSLTEQEKYITLVSCDMQHKNYRYVVFAHEIERILK